mgnify:CR=1 FL=1
MKTVILSTHLREAKKLGLPDLQMEEIGMRLRVTIPITEQSAIADTTEQVGEQVTEQVRRILKCLTKEPIGAREIMKKLGLRHRPTFLYEYLQPALNGNFIEMTQPRSPKSPTQKYRLTAKGKAMAEEGK